MQTFATITQKGQVYIPKTIRTKFGLKPYSKVNFEDRDEFIVIKPVKTTDEMLGFVTSAKSYSDAEYKQAVQSALKEKFSKK